MKKYVFAVLPFFACMCVNAILLPSLSLAQTAHDNPVDVIMLFPGDSRSIEFEYDNVLGQPDSYHVALITAMAPDQEIHQLVINLSPRGDVGPQVAYFTWGIFFCFTGGIFDFVEVLDPKFTYGFNSVNYTVAINPYMSVGMLFSAPTSEFSGFDFPLEMTMTLTLSN